jgi:C4-dicarboxylate transporter DctM subunit
MTWIMVDIAFLALSAVILYTSFGYLEMQLKFAQYTPALRIPYYIPYFILPLASD